MANQSEILRVYDFLELVGFDYEQMTRIIKFLEGRGTIEDLDDLRKIVKIDNEK